MTVIKMNEQLERIFRDEFLRVSMKIIHVGSKLQAEKGNIKFYLDKNDYKNVYISAENLKEYSIIYDSLHAYLTELLQLAKKLNISMQIDVQDLTNFDDLLKE